MKDVDTRSSDLEKNNATRKQLYWNTLVRFPSHAIRIVSSILVARMLLPQDFGVMGVGMMLIGYANLFTTFGFGDALVQHRITDRRLVNSVFTIDLSVSLFLALLFFVASNLIAEFFNTPQAGTVIKVLSSYFIITAFQSTPLAILRRQMDFKAISIIEIIKSIMITAVTLSLAIMQFGYWALVLGQLIPYIAASIMLCVWAKWVPMLYFNHNLMKRIYDFGFWSFMKSQMEFISKNTDKFFIGRWMGTAALGFYDKGMSLAIMPLNRITLNINSVLFSSFSRNQENKRTLQKQLAKALTLIAGMNFPLYVGLAVTAPYMVNSLLGEKWAPMIPSFQIILTGCMFKSFAGMITAFNVGVGKYRRHTIFSLVAQIGFIGACFALLGFGIEGMAVGFFIYNIVYIGLTGNITRRILEVEWLDLIRPVIPPLLGSLIMGGSVYALATYLLPAYTIANLIALICFGVCVYSGYILFDKSWQTRELKKTITKDFSKIPFAGKILKQYSLQ